MAREGGVRLRGAGGQPFTSSRGAPARTGIHSAWRKSLGFMPVIFLKVREK